MIFDGRGLFWWADEPVPAHHFAPNSCVPGVLKIDDDGNSLLELDGNLPSEHGAFAPMVERELPPEKGIKGIIKGSNQHVLLLNLIRNGGQMNSDGISYERYFSTNSLLSDSIFRDFERVKKISVSLSGYEHWLGLNSLKHDIRSDRTTVTYTRPKNILYKLQDGSLAIEFSLGGQFSGDIFAPEARMKETASAVLTYDEHVGVAEARLHYEMLDDLLMLLTGSSYKLDWPTLFDDTGAQARLYFSISSGKRSGESPKYYECLTRFSQVRQHFGSLWEVWRSKREDLGPTYYLYLATRRGLRMYAEHRFVSLVWGMEALHRRRKLMIEPSALANKISRILSDVKLTRDRKWLEGKLRTAQEPSLSERFSELIFDLHLGLQKRNVNLFSERCAQLRNDIPHFGGLREKTDSYDNFISELIPFSNSLSILHEALLLSEVGVDTQIIKNWIYKGYRSHSIRGDFVKTGLLDANQ